MQTSLLDCWRLYCKDFQSPCTFIDMSFYSLISSALQRRVWLGSTERPIFPNQYIVLCGPAALGKGLVLRPIGEILKHHKKQLFQHKGGDMSDAARKELEEKLESLKRDISDAMKKKGPLEDPLLLPVAADATTYEAIVQENAKSIGTIKLDHEHPFAPGRIYTHNSLTFHLEEMSSLFKKHQEDVVKYLTAAWDCGEYRYKTKHMGEDIVKKSCLNMLAGTTPVFMQECFSTKLMEDGFTSRIIFVFETKPRFIKFALPEFSQEQLEGKERIKTRVLQLSKLFGQAKLSPDCLQYLTNYYEKIEATNRPNKSPLLESYYGRKNLHLQKMAMSMHFAESDSMEIPIEVGVKVIELLASLEKSMHMALDTIDENNPSSRLTKKILKMYQKENPISYKSILIRCDAHPNFDDVISFLKTTGQLVEDTRTTEDGREIKMLRKVDI
jgi:hypothetical protein